MSERPENFRSGANTVYIAVLLVVFVILGVIYGIVNPIFEAPDEIQHFFYVVHVAEGKGLPRQDLSGAQALWKQEGSQPPAYYALAAALIAPLDLSAAPSLVWENEHANLGNPLYPINKNRIVHTAREAWPYRGAVLAIHLVRWLSLLLGVGTVLLTYLIAIELLPDRPQLALAAAALTAFMPQFLFISSSISNDNLVTFLATLTAYLLARGIRRPHGWSWTLLLGVALGLAALAKLSGLLLWPFAGVTLVILGARRHQLRRTFAELAVIFGVALVISFWWYARNWLLYRDLFGLNPMLDVVGRHVQSVGWRALLGQFQGLRISYWALFGWFNLPLPETIYRILDIFALLAILGLGMGLLSGRIRRAERGYLWLPLAWIGLMLLGLVRWTLTTPGTQGRLLFPAVWAINLLLMLGWSCWVRGRLRTVWMAAPITFLAVLAVLAPFAFIRPAYERPALILADAIPADARREPIQYGDHVQAVGVKIDPTTAHPGDTVWVTIYWSVLAPLNRDDTVFIHLLDQEGRSIAQANSWPGQGTYPTSLWQPGTVIVDRYPVQIPVDATAPQLLRADAGFFRGKDAEQPSSGDGDNAGGLNILGSVRLLPRLAAQVQPAQPLEASLGDAIKLLGYDLAPAGTLKPGQDTHLTLYWRGDRSLGEDYSVFVHLRDQSGKTVAQADGFPAAGAWPTSAWEPNQPVVDDRTIPIPADLAPGRYGLWAGMYRLSDQTRLPIQASGQEVQDDAILLGEIEVTSD